MVVVPPESPVTNPVALTVAIAGDEDVQGFVNAAVAEPVNCELKPTQEIKIPVIVGDGLMIMELFAVVEPHSLVTFKENGKVPDVL